MWHTHVLPFSSMGPFILSSCISKGYILVLIPLGWVCSTQEVLWISCLGSFFSPYGNAFSIFPWDFEFCGWRVVGSRVGLTATVNANRFFCFLYFFWGWQYWSVTLWTVFVSLYPKWVIASTEWIFSFDIEESCTLFPIRCSLNFSWGFMGWFLSFMGKSKVWCCLFLSCKTNSRKSMPPVDNERKWTTHVPHI